jgi:hypothetical protein
MPQNCQVLNAFVNKVIPFNHGFFHLKPCIQHSFSVYSPYVALILGLVTALLIPLSLLQFSSFLSVTCPELRLSCFKMDWRYLE